MNATTYPIRPDQEWSKGLYRALRLAQLHLAQQHLADLRAEQSTQTAKELSDSDTRDRADERWRHWASQMARRTWQQTF